ncbi:MAG TPA: diacylglycerol kinase family protein [Solirubrobacteraceae bacterium]|nr:diacylglycerol kinase family protein [Solirubrobacteraceae bacterium]
MRVALVTNAASGRGTDAERVAALLRDAGAHVAVHAFDPAGSDAAVDEAARAAAAEHPDRLAVAGGDGSIGPVAVHAAAIDVPLAVIPTGTANDFARALDLPRDVEDAARLAATDARERVIDLLRAAERPFLNAASVGLSVIAAHRARPLKRPLGPLAYAVGALRAGLTARPLRCRVTVDGAQVFAGEAWQVIVAGTGAFGGGSELEEADPADRLVDVAVLEAGPRVALVRRAFGMRNGSLVEQPGVHHARGRTVELGLPRGTPFNVDGEVCEVSPTRFCARGERVRVVVP